MRSWCLAAAACTWLLWAAGTAAQVNVDTPRSAELAREFVDPLTTLPQIFAQDAYTPANYGTDAPLNRFIVRALVPRIPRIAFVPVQLIRPSFQLVTVPTGPGSATRTELGDMQLLDFAILPWPDRERTGLLLGVGPTFVFPTATDPLAGQGAWQVGPGAAAIYKGIPGILMGKLLQNPISFARTSGDRQPVSALLFQPILLAYIGRGFYVKSADATWTMGWYRGSPFRLRGTAGPGTDSSSSRSSRRSATADWRARRRQPLAFATGLGGKDQRRREEDRCDESRPHSGRSSPLHLPANDDVGLARLVSAV